MSKEGNMEELQARIEELEAEVREANLRSNLAIRDAAKASAALIRADLRADARWRERIEGKARESDQKVDSARRTGWPGAIKFHQERAALLRSLLDSGEERECPDCHGQGEVPKFGIPGDWSPCGTCERSGRASTPSTALHREGRCHGCSFVFERVFDFDKCPRCATDWKVYPPTPVAVPEKVEVNAEDLEELLDTLEITSGPLRAALAAFRATEEGK
jgi:hypothetical protein